MKFFSSGGATLYKNPSDQTVYSNKNRLYTDLFGEFSSLNFNKGCANCFHVRVSIVEDHSTRSYGIFVFVCINTSVDNTCNRNFFKLIIIFLKNKSKVIQLFLKKSEKKIPLKRSWKILARHSALSIPWRAPTNTVLLAS